MTAETMPSPGTTGRSLYNQVQTIIARMRNLQASVDALEVRLNGPHPSPAEEAAGDPTQFAGFLTLAESMIERATVQIDHLGEQIGMRE